MHADFTEATAINVLDHLAAKGQLGHDDDGAAAGGGDIVAGVRAGRLRYLLVNAWRSLDAAAPVMTKPLALLHAASCGAVFPQPLPPPSAASGAPEGAGAVRGVAEPAAGGETRPDGPAARAFEAPVCWGVATCAGKNDVFAEHYVLLKAAQPPDGGAGAEAEGRGEPRAGCESAPAASGGEAAHEWYFYSGMRSNEVLMFISYDSVGTAPQRAAAPRDGGAAAFPKYVFHAAFDAEAEEGDAADARPAPPRRSVEVRVVVVLEC